MKNLLSALRHFSEGDFQHDPHLHLERGKSGKMRYHREYQIPTPHPIHHPSVTPPMALNHVRMIPLQKKVRGVQEGGIYLAQGKKMLVKKNIPDIDPTDEAELGAYTVLSSLGFRYPAVHVVRGAGFEGAASEWVDKSADLQDLIHQKKIQPPGDMRDHQMFLPYDPRDGVCDQRLVGSVLLDGDRNARNIILDQQGRRWDIDAGLSLAGVWVNGMFEDDHAKAIVRQLEKRTQESPHDREHVLDFMHYLSRNDTREKFDWLKSYGGRAYDLVGADDPHQSIMDALDLLQPRLEKALKTL